MSHRDPDVAVSRVLRTGLYVSQSLLLVGWLGHMADRRPVGGLAVEALGGGRGWATGALWWGLVLLVMTPVARIVTTMVAYGRRPASRSFAVLALASLTVIGAGVLLGAAPV